MDRLDSSLCTQGCGFFGNASFDGMCSKCFKDNLKKKAAQQNDQHNSGPSVVTPVSTAATTNSELQSSSTPLKSSDIPIPVINNVVEELASSPSSQLSVTPPEDKGKSPSKGRNRCFTCNKKVGLTGFKCRCENLFCGLHRYSDQHQCPFDYKSDGRAKLEKENPQVVGAKIRKI
ncbi:hypothetical protein ACHWQZ_G012286 [Mnemiopsis leidyi]